jgi:hypothetical protein
MLVKQGPQSVLGIGGAYARPLGVSGGMPPPQENFEIQASKMHGHNASKFNGYQKIVDTFLCLNYLILAKHLYRTQLKYIQN